MIDKLRSLFRTRAYLGLPTDKRLWIFSSTDNKAFNYNSSYMFKYVVESLPQITPRYVINDAEKRAELSREYGEEYFVSTDDDEGLETVMRGGVWFTSAGLPAYAGGLSRDRLIVNLWHGIPLKRIALLDPQEPAYKKLYFRRIFSRNYTHVVTTSEEVGKVMAKSLGVDDDKIKIWGQPRCDCLFGEFDAGAFLKERYPDVPAGSRRILYAPTFRSDKPVRLFPFDDFSKEGLERFLEEEDAYIFIRTHSRETADVEGFVSDRVRLMNADVAEDVTEVLPLFDMLITDYSSVYIDYMILGRPMVFLPYDLGDYENKHGFNFPYDDVTPGDKPGDFEEFKAAAGRALRGEFDTEKLAKAGELFHEVEGDSCRRIAEAILEELEDTVQ
ncbi:MAG: CDP-glycerol glycerophosphotransferase family protein [Eubacterium sp.]|nr:CDP-glycerol glycerophosphotransferase family protein [Eubacterium sp.]